MNILNLITHIYDELAARRLVGIILKDYIPAFVKRNKGIEEYYGAELKNIQKYDRIIQDEIRKTCHQKLQVLNLEKQKYRGVCI